VNGAYTPRLVTQTHGMGVDSAAWLAGVLLGELPAPFDVADLTVVTAMVGDESQATRHAMHVGKRRDSNVLNDAIFGGSRRPNPHCPDH
jgi:hypothetical protein